MCVYENAAFEIQHMQYLFSFKQMIPLFSSKQFY